MSAIPMRAGLVVTLGVLANATATAAGAEGAGYFAGFEGGAAQYSKRDLALDLGTDVVRSRDQKRTDAAWSVNFGYRATRYIGWEAAYHDFGKTSARLAGTTATGNVELDSRGASVALIGAIPFGEKWEATWKAGYLFAHSTLSLSVGGPAAFFTAKDTSKSEKPFGSLGLAYNASSNWSFGLSFATYGVGDSETGKAHVSTAGLSVTYRF